MKHHRLDRPLAYGGGERWKTSDRAIRLRLLLRENDKTSASKGMSVMLIQKLNACPAFKAGDGTELRELLHPDKQAIALRYSLAHAIVAVGQTSLPHTLKTSEVYYILSGQGEMTIDDERQTVEPGDAVYIPPHAQQFIRNRGTEPLVFICLVDPAWRKEDEVIYATGEPSGV